MLKAVLHIFLFFFFITGLLGQGDFRFTKPLEKAYSKTLSLRINESNNLLSSIKETDPDNTLILLFEDYNDFFTILIKEEHTLYKEKIEGKESRIQQIKKSDQNSPYYLYAQADIRLHWALLALKFEEYYKAFSEVNKAFKLLKRNIEKYPNFMPNYKDIGILHAAVGTIPSNYRTGIAWFTSLEGTIDQGAKEVTKVLDYAKTHHFPFATETKVLYAFLLLHLEHEPAGAWEVINTNDLKPQSNPLHCFIVSNIAMRTGQNEKAFELLSNQPKSRAFLPMPFLDFMLGLTKLRRLDQDTAPYFQAFITQFNGKHYIKEAYQKLAWGELIQGNKKGYNKYMRACISHGNQTAGGDKNAYKEALEESPPNPILLKARLLFDGGYYEKGLQILKNYNPDQLTHTKDILEYTYRKGRLLHGLERHKEALEAYQQTISKGRTASYFFACNAALKMGEIQEVLQQWDESKKAFENCLSIYPDEYRTGLHQQAKAGLNRLKNR